jgi:hypothetical protein
MITEVRVYVEGGGDGKDTKANFRQGLGAFLKDLVQIARERRIKWCLVACGSRNETFNAFATALQVHPEAFNVLLVDSEDPVNNSPWQHLKARDHWDTPPLGNERCHLMVQMLEAWLVADVDALGRFYGRGFRAQAIPRQKDVEQISKDTLQSALKQATQDTQPGEYHKTRHTPKLLALLDVHKVRQSASYCERLFSTLTAALEQS